MINSTFIYSHFVHVVINICVIWIGADFGRGEDDDGAREPQQICQINCPDTVHYLF